MYQKMDNSHFVIFGKIWPSTLYYNSTRTLGQFLRNFKNLLKNSIFSESAIQHQNIHVCIRNIKINNYLHVLAILVKIYK